MTYHFTKEEKSEMAEGFENGASLYELARKFGCSKTPIGKILIAELENYKQITKEHLSERSRKMGQLPMTEKQLEHARKWQEAGIKAAAKLPRSEKQLEHSRKMGQKMGKAPRTEKQLKIFQSSWEDAFLEKFLEPNFRKYTIKRQHYLKGFNHPYDFAILELKVLIEIDSDYRHGHSGYPEMDKKAIARDKEVDKWAKQNSRIVFRYHDEDLRKLGIIK